MGTLTTGRSGWRGVRELLSCLLLAAPALPAQQVVDTAWRPLPRPAAYSPGTGPRVLLDIAHHNPSMATLLPLRRLLDAEGHRVGWHDGALRGATLRDVDILVIIDALATENVDHWILPVLPALDSAEQAAVVDWVHAGGALLLVADHMPFAGAVGGLIAALGVESLNGFAIDTVAWEPLTFRRADGSLRPHPITEGRSADERVDSVSTYWGHAFRPVDPGAGTLLVLPEGVVSLQPQEAWRFQVDTEVRAVGGWSHGLALTVGAGRVVLLGDSGLIQAHRVGARATPVGLGARDGGQNEQFVRNLFRWLGRLLD